jgi:hypothetical protein
MPRNIIFVTNTYTLTNEIVEYNQWNNIHEMQESELSDYHHSIRANPKTC